MIRRDSKRKQPEASKFPAAQKQLEKLDAEIERLRTAAASASADEHGDAMLTLQAAVDERYAFWRTNVIGPEQASRYITEVAKPMGLA
jgi:hypothetical protein